MTGDDASLECAPRPNLPSGEDTGEDMEDSTSFEPNSFLAPLPRPTPRPLPLPRPLPAISTRPGGRFLLKGLPSFTCPLMKGLPRLNALPRLKPRPRLLNGLPRLKGRPRLKDLARPNDRPLNGRPLALPGLKGLPLEPTGRPLLKGLPRFTNGLSLFCPLPRGELNIPLTLPLPLPRPRPKPLPRGALITGTTEGKSLDGSICVVEWALSSVDESDDWDDDGGDGDRS